MSEFGKLDIAGMMASLPEGLDIPDDEFTGLSDSEIIRLQIKKQKDQHRDGLLSRFTASMPEATRRAVETINIDAERYAVTTMRRKWSGKSGHSPACVLVGPPGTGKTVAACWAAKRMLEIYRMPATYISVPAYANQVGAGFDNPRTWERVLKIEEDVEDYGRIIILDDLGRERDSVAVRDRVGYLIDNLWKRLAMAVITTNLSPEPLYSRYGDYAGSRMFDPHWTTMVECSGTDNRISG